MGSGAVAAGRDKLYDANAERSIVGSILIEPGAIDALADLHPHDFFQEPCGWAFFAARRLRARGLAIDLTTLEAELTAGGHWRDMGGIGFLTSCEAGTASALHVTSYARIVKDFAERRRAFDLAGRLARAALNSNGQFPEELQDAAHELQAMTAAAASQPDRFKVTWAADALAQLPPIPWVIEPLFSEGSVSLIVGEGGTKKTYSMLDAAVSIALGQPWLTFTTTPGLALVIDEESGDRRMRQRLYEVLHGHDAGPDTPIGAISMSSLNLLDGKDAPELQAVIGGNGAKFVLIDALADIVPGGDENSVKDIQPVFHALRVIANDEHCHVAVIHHANRSGSYRGSSALKGAADLMLMVTCDGDRVTFKTEKARDIEPVTFSALANFGEGTFCLSPAQSQESGEHLTKSEEYVLRYLKEHPNAQMGAIMGSADVCASGSARNAVYRLVQRGHVRRTDGGGSGSRATFGLVEGVT